MFKTRSIRLSVVSVLTMLMTMFVGVGTANAAAIQYSAFSVPTVDTDNAFNKTLGNILVEIGNDKYLGAGVNWVTLKMPSGVELLKDGETQDGATGPSVTIENVVGGSVYARAHVKNSSTVDIMVMATDPNAASATEGEFIITFRNIRVQSGSGNLNVTFIPQSGSALPGGTVTIANIVSKGATQAMVTGVKNLAEGGGFIDTIRIAELSPYAIPSGEKIYFELPEGFTWNVDSTSIKGTWGFEGLNFVLQDIDNEGRTLIIKVPDELDLIRSAGRIDIENLKINALESLAPEGYIKVSVHSDKEGINPQELVVALYVKNYDDQQVLVVSNSVQNAIITALKPTLKLIFPPGSNPQDYTLNLIATSGKPKVNLPKTGESFITPQMIISSAGGVQLEIPGGTIITGPSGWDGTIDLPVVVNTPSQKLGSDHFVIKAGSENGSLDFSEPVWLFAPGQGKKEVKVIRNGTIYDVTHILPSNTLAAAKEALTNGRIDAKYIDGDDLHIWTTRFSEFVAYTPVSIPPVGGGGGGGGGGGTTTSKSQRISTDGGTVSALGVSIYVPANAITKEIYISIEKRGAISHIIPEQYQLISEIYNITKDKSEGFIYPVTITLPFDKKKADKELHTVSLYWYDEQAKVWEQLDNIIVDWQKGTVAGEVDHFTKFAVLAKSNVQDTLLEEPEVTIKDIKGHWAEEDITKLENRKIISGYPDGNFWPDRPITRAEFAVALVKAYGLSLTEGTKFEDSSNHWAKDYIATANAYNIVSGYNDDSFGPDDHITREQMAVMINNAAKFDADGMPITFMDKEDISEWAKNAVERVASNQLINGYPDGTFKPKQSTTRAEALTVIAKALGI